MGGPADDLYVVANVRAHPIFHRDGKHLYLEVPISFADAALSRDVDVPTLGGRVKLTVPDSTDAGKLFLSL
ncbi:DnaJ C-terminal domain-containing protein, partial [Pseudomonas aeruginosa]|uniref:DnaJ C-terminal domain-containing protein n=1 Tax=Pseudomonas aeruginosa TaxID=287 RepID=UPI0039B6A052